MKIFNALCAGACGYLIKKTPPARLIEAILEAHNGGSPMSAHIARKVVGYFQNNIPKSNDPDINLSNREKEILSRFNIKFIFNFNCINVILNSPCIQVTEFGEYARVLSLL